MPVGREARSTEQSASMFADLEIANFTDSTSTQAQHSAAPAAPGLAQRVVAQLRRCAAARACVLEARRLQNILIDRELGIRTVCPRGRTIVGPTTFDDPVYYEATDYALLGRYIKPLRLRRDDVIFEVGCGMGRTLCVLALMPVRKCVGIEVLPELSQRAVANARRLRGRRAEIEIRCCDAVFTDYSQGTVFWFNNPFGPDSLLSVMQQIEHSLQLRPRAIQIAYIYPRHEHVMRSFPWLRQVHREDPLLFTTSQGSYWTNDLPDGWRHSS